MARGTCAALTLAAAMSWGALASAVDFSAADALYHQRAQGFVKATAAREAYEALLASTQGDDLVYAVSQMSRLDLYRGGMVKGIDVATRKKALDECLANTARIKSTGRQEYYFFYTACLGFRGKLSSALERVKYGLLLRQIQTAALDSSRNASGQLVGGFEGGGILRVLSAVRGNRQAKPLGLYNPQEALQFAQIALNAPARQERPYPRPLSGKDYYENDYYYAQAQISLAIENSDGSLAKKGGKILGNSIERLNDLEAIDDLPAGHEPETKYYKGLMEELKANVDHCTTAADWKACLIAKLG